MKREKKKLNEGIQIGADVYDDQGRLIGKFGFRCASCGWDYFVMDGSFEKTLCGKCGAQTSYKDDGSWKRPQESPMRKCLMFDTSFGGTYIWVCSVCGHDISTLEGNLMTMTCERCKGVTSRRLGQEVSVDGQASWIL